MSTLGSHSYRGTVRRDMRPKPPRRCWRHAGQIVALRRIVAITSPDNWASIAVLEKIGLKFERMIRLTAQDEELKLFGCAAPHPRQR